MRGHRNAVSQRGPARVVPARVGPALVLKPLAERADALLLPESLTGRWEGQGKAAKDSRGAKNQQLMGSAKNESIEQKERAML